MKSIENASENTGQRYVFIDALRGVAALAVLLHHIMLPGLTEIGLMTAAIRNNLPDFVYSISSYGRCGVQIFFVLSGFVIAHSLRDNPLTFKSIGNFMIRRQIRLDLPYWFVLIAVLCLHLAELLVPALNTSPMPAPGTIFANFFYLQNILKVEPIVLVAWTLCIEIQFYVTFIVLLACADRISKLIAPHRIDENQHRINGIFVALIFVTGLAPLCSTPQAFDNSWFGHYWFYFAGGVLCYWAVRNWMNHWALGGFMLLLALSALRFWYAGATELFTSVLAGSLTILGIYIVGIKGHLTDWWSNSILQYFGRISYSLYLVHLIILDVFLRGAFKLTGDNGKMAVVWFLLAIIVCIGIAHLLFIGIERPSMRLASRIKNTPGRTQRSDQIEKSESGLAIEAA